jgi:hypothetical protein
MAGVVNNAAYDNMVVCLANEFFEILLRVGPEEEVLQDICRGRHQSAPLEEGQQQLLNFHQRID